MAPVGQYVHDLADEIERLTAELKAERTVSRDLAYAVNESEKENAKLQAVVDAAESLFVCGLHHTVDLDDLQIALAALEGGDDE
jgi:uncharacterized small protein (DUF1192 family)